MCEPLLLSNFLIILFALRIMYATHLDAVKFLENLSERVKKKNHLSLLYALLNPELVFTRGMCVFN